MKLKMPIVFSFILLVSPCLAMCQSIPASEVAQAFVGLGPAKVLNEIFIPDFTNPGIVALLAGKTSESISVISLARGQVQTVWNLPQLPDFMSGVSPANLRVITTDSGPVILLHGCAPHLCGGKGLAGALVYVINAKRLYTAYASYDNTTQTTKFVYSPEESTAEFQMQKKRLDEMLRDEGYNPNPNT